MRVKTTNNSWSNDLPPPDNVIGIQLTEDELLRKKEIFANWGGDDYYYFGDTAKIIYFYFSNL